MNKTQWIEMQLDRRRAQGFTQASINAVEARLAAQLEFVAEDDESFFDREQQALPKGGAR